MVNGCAAACRAGGNRPDSGQARQRFWQVRLRCL